MGKASVWTALATVLLGSACWTRAKARTYVKIRFALRTAATTALAKTGCATACPAGKGKDAMSRIAAETVADTASVPSFSPMPQLSANVSTVGLVESVRSKCRCSDVQMIAWGTVFAWTVSASARTDGADPIARIGSVPVRFWGRSATFLPVLTTATERGSAFRELASAGLSGLGKIVRFRSSATRLASLLAGLTTKANVAPGARGVAWSYRHISPSGSTIPSGTLHYSSACGFLTFLYGNQLMSMRRRAHLHSCSYLSYFHREFRTLTFIIFSVFFCVEVRDRLH